MKTVIDCRGKMLDRCSCVLALLIIAFCAGAAGGGEQIPPSENVAAVPDRSTPDHLLQFYVTAHEGKDIKMYEQTLHQDYVFILDSKTAARQGLPKGKAWISRAKDVFAADSMFRDPSIGSIRMQLLPLTEWRSSTAVAVGASGWPEAMDAVEIDLDPTLAIEVRTLAGSSKVYTFNRNIIHMIVVPDPEVPGSWVILRIEEEIQSD